MLSVNVLTHTQKKVQRINSTCPTLHDVPPFVGDQGDKGDRGATERGPSGVPGVPGLPGREGL